MRRHLCNNLSQSPLLLHSLLAYQILRVLGDTVLRRYVLLVREKTINWYISVCIVLRAIELWRGLSLIIAAGRPTRIILGIQICVSLAPHLQIRTNYYEI